MTVCSGFRKTFRVVLFCLLGLLASPAAFFGMGFPEFENEFFNDFSGSVSNQQKIEISRNLRLASEASQIHAMIVVIRKMADHQGMPQEIHSMAVQLAEERKVGSQKTHQGLLALFSVEDRKFDIAKTSNLSPDLVHSIREVFNGRVRAKLRDGQTGQALVFASEDMASLLPKARTPTKAGAGSALSGSNPSSSDAKVVPRERPQATSSGDSGMGAGTWILLIFGGYILLSILGRLFSGGGGLGRGGGPGWGGLLGALLGGGLIGYWLGNSSSNASEGHTHGGGGGEEGSSFGSGAGGSDSSGFDSFGGGDFGGGDSGGGDSGGDW